MTEPIAAPATVRAATPEELVELIGDVGRIVADVGRSDLGERLAQARNRLQDPTVRVVVVGEFKQGKSKLINALVNAPVCPVDDDIATSVPTEVGYGAEPQAWIITRVPEVAGATGTDRTPVAIEDLAAYVSERGNPGNEQGIVAAEASLPREILKGGLRLVDSPGVGGLESRSALSTLTALASAHAVLLVSDASQEYTEPEVQFLRYALRLSPNVAAVLAKTDLYPQWRQIESIDRGHLGDVGDVPIFAVSSDLRLLAAAGQDRELNAESGFPALVAHLRRNVVEHAALLHTQAAAHDLRSVVEQMAIAVRTELEALRNPSEQPRILAELQDATARAEEFRGRTAKWQIALNDGIGDLISDMEHDLRERLRKVQREAEDAIDEGDPGPIWEQIVEWIDQRTAAAVAETFVWTNERSRWLTEEVAGLFAEGERTLPTIAVGDVDGVLDAVERPNDLDPGRMNAAEKIYIGVRGSYGGVLMVGLATGLIGLTLINPISLLAGVLVGRRAYREDMSARLARRRFEAKSLVRRYVDDTVFQSAKQLKDRLRMVQRTARDHFGGIADELYRSLTEAVNRARAAAGAYSTDREKQLARLQAQSERLTVLQRRLAALPEREPDRS
ncbi:dynamin family protein [Microbacterium sp. SYP-A9085]|uniref:dynamin family protein n=1 Tax=Microbacterium sp. SYP-A9085 TaxID=2664454 RepID=UPI003463F87A